MYFHTENQGDSIRTNYRGQNCVVSPRVYMRIHPEGSYAQSQTAGVVFLHDSAGRAAAIESRASRAGEGQLQGRAVHVDPRKPTQKAPSIKRVKLKYDNLLSSLAFIFSLTPNP